MSKIVIVSGGFDPLHEGHIALFKAAAALGDKLIVAINSDDWLIRKKGYCFQTFKTRMRIIENIKYVHHAVSFDDSDNSARNAIIKIQQNWGPQHHYIFANGGDRNGDNIPEMDMKDVEFVFGVGGTEKMNSSSEIVKNFMDHGCVKRAWGRYKVLEEGMCWKIKELIVNPNSCLSYQRHERRAEVWLVKSGAGTAIIDTGAFELYEGTVLNINHNDWHQLINGCMDPLVIHEIQHGGDCEEEDVVRQ